MARTAFQNAVEAETKAVAERKRAAKYLRVQLELHQLEKEKSDG